MLIGIDASHAFLEYRMGVEEYSYQIIKALAKVDHKNRYILYLNGIKNKASIQEIKWPNNFKFENIPLKRFWTHLRLGFRARADRVDVLFIPAQAMPIIPLSKTVVTLHGLEYEHYPESYSWKRRIYLKATTRYSLKHARSIIAVSRNTKNDLVKMYQGKPDKIKVVYHGFDAPFQITNGVSSFSSLPTIRKPYILALGRLEQRKNIVGLVKAFDQFKKESNWRGQLILVGKPGFGYQEIKKAITDSLFSKDIIQKGYVSEEEKWAYLKKSILFVFPSLYEGFGLPILEAFVAKVPVIASNVASIPEVGGSACLYFDPKNIFEISKRISLVLGRQDIRERLIKKGYQRLQKFSWEKCSRETLQVLESAA